MNQTAVRNKKNYLKSFDQATLYEILMSVNNWRKAYAKK